MRPLILAIAVLVICGGAKRGCGRIDEAFVEETKQHLRENARPIGEVQSVDCNVHKVEKGGCGGGTREELRCTVVFEDREPLAFDCGRGREVGCSLR